ncbi:MAG: carbonic anhydrase [Anaerolineae bacterium]|nr:carbonic anhydrase [Anaerolineae bacterium]
MSSRFGVLIVIYIAINLLTVGVIRGQEATEMPRPPHWTYEGEEGPQHWGDLAIDFALCSTGRAQSPIDISQPQAVNLADIAFDYQPTALNIFNNGHTVQVAYDAGSSMIYNETQYDLLQFHFHIPSEHTLNGEAFAMELHFVHRSADGDLAVVGVLLRESDAANKAYAPLFDNLPAEKGDPQPTELTIDANNLLPAERLYTTYSGSLTTPPCTQGVRWLVLQTPVEISHEQVEAFAQIFELNARPVQDQNNRDLLSDNG